MREGSRSILFYLLHEMGAKVLNWQWKAMSLDIYKTKPKRPTGLSRGTSVLSISSQMFTFRKGLRIPQEGFPIIFSHPTENDRVWSTRTVVALTSELQAEPPPQWLRSMRLASRRWQLNPHPPHRLVLFRRLVIHEPLERWALMGKWCWHLRKFEKMPCVKQKDCISK